MFASAGLKPHMSVSPAGLSAAASVLGKRLVLSEGGARVNTALGPWLWAHTSGGPLVSVGLVLEKRTEVRGLGASEGSGRVQVEECRLPRLPRLPTLSPSSERGAVRKQWDSTFAGCPRGGEPGTPEKRV